MEVDRYWGVTKGVSILQGGFNSPPILQIKITMNKFRVFVKGKFDVVFDTIEKARDCRKALKQLKYKGIEIIVTQEDIDPR